MIAPVSLYGADEPVVYGVFFYSPTCPHCHEVINNHWPAIQAEFGDQLRVLFIDASGRQGGQIMMLAVQSLNIDSTGVPMLIIGDEVMVGSIEIPARAPEVIRQGLASGGIGLPAIPGIEEFYQVVIEREQAARQEAAAESAENPTEAAEGLVKIEAATLWDRLRADPVANALAVIVLVGLVASAGVVLAAGWQALSSQRPAALLEWMDGPAGRWVLRAAALASLGLAAALMVGGDAGVTPITAAVMAALLLVTVMLLRATGQPESWLLPVAALVGLAVAGYLAHVETTASEAVCGVVGDCNTVQQSPYARIFGIPIGLIGVAGYVAILLVWFYGQVGSRRLADAALLLMALFGVVFSIYLTFLEPFVIGATCLWCLTSAALMALILWLAAPAGWRALADLAARPEERRRTPA